MLPHPYKTDTWTDEERIRGNNLCNEIIQPMAGNTVCTLGMKPSMLKYLALNNDIHQTQVHGRVWHLIGDTNLKAINSFYSGANPAERMDSQEVLALARELYDEHEENLTELYNTLGALRSIQFEERTKLMGSFAIQQAFKEKGTMTEITEQTASFAKITQAKEYGVFGGLKQGELSIISSHNNPMGDVSTDTQELTRIIGEAGERGIANPKGPTLTSLDKPRKIKRKKSKPKSNHLPNMRNARTKRVLGATILNMLGKVQQDTADAYKRTVLKEMPLADVVEAATGATLPDYQANLLNAMQAKADPTAPIVTKMQNGVIADETVSVNVEDGSARITNIGRGLTKHITPVDQSPFYEQNAVFDDGDYAGTTAEARVKIYEDNLDRALAQYITPDLFHDTVSVEQRNEIVARVRASVLEHKPLITKQTLVMEVMRILHPLETITV